MIPIINYDSRQSSNTDQLVFLQIGEKRNILPIFYTDNGKMITIVIIILSTKSQK